MSRLWPKLLAAAVVACGTESPAPPAPSGEAPNTAPPIAPPAGTTTPAATPSATGDLRAGVAVVDATPKVGVPLAGYSKRRRLIPDFDPNNEVRYFAPSTAVHDAIQAKALVIESGGERVYFLTLDAIAVLGDAADRIVEAARKKGATVTRERLLASASHTHSGPGAMTSLGFWVQAAADELVPHVRDAFVEAHADAIVRAEAAMVPARFGIGMSELHGTTKNRRAGVSKTFKPETIDPELAVIRVDTEAGAPLATLYNFGIHGTALPAANEAFSADVMGAISAHVTQATGAPTLFANAAEADIGPAANGEAEMAQLGAIIGAKVAAVRDAISVRDRVRIRVSNETVDFGNAELKLRPDGLSSGAIDLSLLGALLGGTSGAQTIPLDSTMVDRAFRMTAVAFDDDVISAIPGEPVHTIGLDIKARGKALGFKNVLVFGLTNGYMSYVTDEAEYEAGGYEAVATFFGKDTGKRLADACVARIGAVK